MSNSQSVALASLTATYTDSENEDDHEEKDPNLSDHSSKDIEESHTPPIPMSNLDLGVIKNKYAKLVSYNDDLVMSEEEGEGEIEKEVASESPTDSDDVQLPPEPSGRCSNELQDKITKLHEKMVSNGLDMNKIIQQRKDFRNPSIYEKLIQFCSINEFGTNYPPEVYDPVRWGPESFYEELAKVQKSEMDRREKERKEKTKVEFVVGTAKRVGSGSNPGSGAEDEAKRRKSKWDQVGLAAASQLILKPVSLSQQSTLTTSATGTKGTVISAFGSLPKKPRM
uniref:SAP30-binding protein n=1 Tax=Cuerna arida TaxID=1464854 RepID=A0A1B6FJ29_9HEMI